MRFPSPLEAQGLAELDTAAQRIGTDVEASPCASRAAAYAEVLLREIRHVVEMKFGKGAGARLERLAPCVGMISRQESLAGYEPGKGRRQMSSYIAGLTPQQPFHDVAEHPWCTHLAAGACTMLEELRAHSGQRELWTTGNSDAPEWRSIVLVKRGLWVARGNFPRTRAIFMALPGVRPMEVCLAKLPPGTKIRPHSDNTNFLLTAHLGLELAEGCTLKVGEWVREWREGEALIFDHSYIHCAANDSTRDRYVLVFRFYHPGCSDEECYALSYLALLLESVLRQGQVPAALQEAERAAVTAGGARSAKA